MNHYPLSAAVWALVEWFRPKPRTSPSRDGTKARLVAGIEALEDWFEPILERAAHNTHRNLALTLQEKEQLVPLLDFLKGPGKHTLASECRAAMLDLARPEVSDFERHDGTRSPCLSAC